VGLGGKETPTDATPGAPAPDPFAEEHARHAGRDGAAAADTATVAS
jgi:hypothetical protein